MVRYLDGYAERHALDVRLGVRVERLDRDGGRWHLITSAGAMHARHVVVAGGYDHAPFVPDWPGRSGYGRPLVHAAAYRSPHAYRDRDVLVVGPGSSGGEIAGDLARGGARRVRLSVRTPPNILLRARVGAPLASVLARLPPRAADAVGRFVRRRTIGDLTAFGLPVPAEGMFSRLGRLGVAPMIVDPEVITAIRERRIEIVAGVEAFDATGVHLADGTRIEPEAVIAATGHRPGLEPVLGHLGVLDARGVPRTLVAEAAPGLRFVGYDPRPAQIGHMGREATRAATAIARQARPAEHGARPLARPAYAPIERS
jgi:hypothetical protein